MDDDAWPEHLLAANHPVRAWNARSDATWEAIRQDYRAGAAARDLCDRYEVALSTLRLKAKEGGWRRADQTDSDLFPADADRWADDTASDAGFAAGDEDWADLAERARFRLRRAIASGRAAEAASWLRVHDRLRALAAAEGTSAAPALDIIAEPDPLDAAMSVAARIGVLARRAARATDEAEMQAIEAEVEALKSRAATLTGDPDPPGADQTLDSLDSLDPVFSDPADEVLAGNGLSPGTRPDPETPAPPASSPGPGPHSGAGTARRSRSPGDDVRPIDPPQPDPSAGTESAADPDSSCPHGAGTEGRRTASSHSPPPRPARRRPP